MNTQELANLKKGDIVRHEPTGADYVVLAMDTTGFPIVTRTIALHTAPDWEQVLPPAPRLSVAERVTELDRRGWRFETEPSARWITPDGYLYYSRDIAYKSRGCHPSKADIEAKKKVERPRPVKSFSEARVALHNAGWRNVYGKVWLSPAGCYFDGTLAAYKSITSNNDGTCNAS